MKRRGLRVHLNGEVDREDRDLIRDDTSHLDEVARLLRSVERAVKDVPQAVVFVVGPAAPIVSDPADRSTANLTTGQAPFDDAATPRCNARERLTRHDVACLSRRETGALRVHDEASPGV